MRTIITYNVVKRNKHGMIISSVPETLNLVHYDERLSKANAVYKDVAEMLKDGRKYTDVKMTDIPSYIGNH